MTVDEITENCEDCQSLSDKQRKGFSLQNQ